MKKEKACVKLINEKCRGGIRRAVAGAGSAGAALPAGQPIRSVWPMPKAVRAPVPQ